MFEATLPDLALAERFLTQHGPTHPVLLCGVTGAHIYGFPSPDSDIDMKGIHLAPTRELVGLHTRAPAHDRLMMFEGVECDLTTHELGHALALLLRGSGNVLERILSPIQLVDGVEELQDLVRASVSRDLSRHYRGFLRGMEREHGLQKRAKTALYAYRVALTGMHLMRTGRLETDVRVLADGRFALVKELVAYKAEHAEKARIPEDLDVCVREDWPVLEAGLAEALESSALPEHVPNRPAIEAWLLGVRKGSW